MRLFGKVVTWSHLVQEARSRPPSPRGRATLTENLRCSTDVIGTTQISSACRFRASLEITSAGRSLSTRTRQISPRRGNQATGAGKAVTSIPCERAERSLLECALLPPILWASGRIKQRRFTLQCFVLFQFKGSLQQFIDALTRGSVTLGALDNF